MAAPAMKRSSSAISPAGATRVCASVTTAASHAQPKNSQRAGHRSASEKIALSKVPKTKPNCTQAVSQAARLGAMSPSASSAGTAAVPANQTESVSTSAPTNSAILRRLLAGEEFMRAARPRSLY